MKQIGDIARELNSNRQAEHSQASSTAQSHYQTERLAQAIGGIKLDMPEGFKMNWGISIEGLRDLLLGLDLTMSQVKKLSGELPAIVKKLDDNAQGQRDELKELVAAVKGIKQPEIIIPELPETLKIQDMTKVIKLLQTLADKPDFERGDVVVPAFPKKITVANISEVAEALMPLLQKEEAYEECPVGFSFKHDSNGNLTTLTEIYPSGQVVSEGWNLGRVRITDERPV